MADRVPARTLINASRQGMASAMPKGPMESGGSTPEGWGRPETTLMMRSSVPAQICTSGASVAENVPSAAEAAQILERSTARLKACPDENHGERTNSEIPPCKDTAAAPQEASLTALAVAAANAPPRSLWTLPETGLAVFHGHPDVPRLFHYFLPRLVAQGKPALVLDGANRFDPLLLARFARSRGPAHAAEAAAFNQRVRVSRAFTCFQMTELLVRVPRLLEKFPARAVIVTALPDLYFDEDVREAEAAASFRRALEALRALRRRPLVTAVFSDAASFQTPRKSFFAQLLAQASQVSRFVEEDGRLALAPASPIGKSGDNSAAGAADSSAAGSASYLTSNTAPARRALPGRCGSR
jgi:hypothetical protein